MSRSHLRASDFREMPWKNGGGFTSELALRPPGASLTAGFVWRLSMAKIQQSGPFSAFPGYERLIMQLSGPPMELLHRRDSASSPIRAELARFAAYRFPGEWATEGKLGGGTAQDFNLMLRRGQAEGELRSFQLAPGTGEHLTLAQACFIYIWEGACEVRSEGEAAAVKVGKGEGYLIENEAGSALRLEAPLSLESPLLCIVAHVST